MGHRESFDFETKAHSREPERIIKLHVWILNRLRILNSNKFIYQWPLSVSELYDSWLLPMVLVLVCARARSRPVYEHLSVFYFRFIWFSMGQTADGRQNNQIFWICILVGGERVFCCALNRNYAVAERILWFSSNALMFYFASSLIVLIFNRSTYQNLVYYLVRLMVLLLHNALVLIESVLHILARSLSHPYSYLLFDLRPFISFRLVSWKIRFATRKPRQRFNVIVQNEQKYCYCQKDFNKIEEKKVEWKCPGPYEIWHLCGLFSPMLIMI